MVHFDAQGHMVRTYRCGVCRKDQPTFSPRASECYGHPVCIPCARDRGFTPNLYE